MENRKYIYQKYENTTGVIRICNSRENRQYIYQKFEDTLITLSLRLNGSGSGCHYNRIYNDTGTR
jgi:hypothetical protein